ncbi:xanthine dehydrogenase small subunit [Agrobacterium sp. rho-8.1]|nr:xanthine dehydrogenase small subunit [Agrobacterium sp. rho-8.1]
MKDAISFILNNETVSLGDFGPTETLLDYLRLQKRLTGTKEGCAEGDCGACTVLVGRLMDGSLRYETVNACIRFMGSLHGTHIVTIEHLSGKDGVLHPVQQAMVDYHGSQCGFCTPGFVMSLYGLWLTSDKPSRGDIEKALQGNLCRCTGYEPIIRAAESVTAAKPSTLFDPIERDRSSIMSRLWAIPMNETITVSKGDCRAIIPSNLSEFATTYATEPKATIVAGSTDVGLWVTKQMRSLTPVIFINHLSELQSIQIENDGISIGAGVTYAHAFTVLAKHIPPFARLIDRIGGQQVRNMGTIGGNIANGSPIGDTPPALIALNATLTLRSSSGSRTIPLEKYFIDYGKQDRFAGEFVEKVFVPVPAPDTHYAIYKISKRRDEDISALCAAYHLKLDPTGAIEDIRIAFGGMAATPKRAAKLEEALRGKPWNMETIDAARDAIDEDFQPLTDWRATAEYRTLTAKNLLTRFFLETSGERQELQRFELAEA